MVTAREREEGGKPIGGACMCRLHSGHPGCSPMGTLWKDLWRTPRNHVTQGQEVGVSHYQLSLSLVEVAFGVLTLGHL